MIIQNYKEEIVKLSNQLGLPNYDLLLIGDGSGTTAAKASGWACYVYDYSNESLSFNFGGATLGTNNYAELMPYIQALWLDSVSVHQKPRRVEIVSDSELSVKCGNHEYSRNSNGILWASLDWLELHGYIIHWNHVPRNSNPFSLACDHQAGIMRRQIENTVDKASKAG